MPALVLTKDLMFASRVAAAAQSVGREAKVVGSVEALLEQAAGGECSLVVLDLDSPGMNPDAAVAAVREQRDPWPPILAVGSHVLEARLEAARQAGCDRVLTRGQFDRQAAEILRLHA